MSFNECPGTYRAQYFVDSIEENKAANQRFDSCEPTIKVGDLYRYTKNNTDLPWPMFYHTGELYCSKPNRLSLSAQRAKNG